MDPVILRDHLAKLHEELRRVTRVDAESGELLGDLLHDIQRLVEQPPPDVPATGGTPTIGGTSTPSGTLTPGAVSAAAGRNASLPDRLEKLAVQFEAEHPSLAASSRRLVDLLGNAGL